MDETEDLGFKVGYRYLNLIAISRWVVNLGSVNYGVHPKTSTFSKRNLI